MQLTEFILDPKLHNKVLATQGQTWMYLEDIFGKLDKDTMLVSTP